MTLPSIHLPTPGPLVQQQRPRRSLAYSSYPPKVPPAERDCKITGRGDQRNKHLELAKQCEAMMQRNTNIAAVERNFGMEELLSEWFISRAFVCLCGGYHGWNNLPRWSDRHHHVYSFFAWLALVESNAVTVIETVEAYTESSTSPAAPVDRSTLPSSYIHWSPTVGGGLIAAAVFFVLITFATAIGLAVSSVSPTWRDTSVGLVVLSGAWVVLTAVGSFALGGYIAGRTRSTWRASPDEVHFRDGLHGLLVWSIAVILGVGLAWMSTATITQSTSKSNVASPNTATASTSGTEPTFLTFELDRLLWSDNRQQTSNPELRAEAGRILETGLGRKELAKDNHDHLVQLVSVQTGLSAADADHRVAQILSESRNAAAKARQSAVILAFTLAAALAAGAAAAWGSAVIGGRHRDENVAPSMRFSWRNWTPHTA